MATGAIAKQLSDSDFYVSQAMSVDSGSSMTITFSATRDNGLISITGNGAGRIALYSFSGMNGITPAFSRVCGANLDSMFSTGSGTLTFSPNYGAVVKVAAFNNAGRITIS